MYTQKKINKAFRRWVNTPDDRANLENRIVNWCYYVDYRDSKKPGTTLLEAIKSKIYYCTFTDYFLKMKEKKGVSGNN